MKKLSNKIAVLMLAVASVFMLAGCDTRQYDQVELGIREEYREKFENREFTLADFDWNNFYAYLYWETSPIYPSKLPGMMMRLRLKEKGLRYVEEAISHLETLSFVRDASYAWTAGSSLGDWIEE